MSSHAKLSTSSRMLTVAALLVACALLFALFPSNSEAKRPKKESPRVQTEPIQTDTSAYDTTLPPRDQFVPVTVIPEMIYKETPIYPPEFEDRLVTGEIRVTVGIDKRGVVRAAGVAHSCGIPALDEAAVAVAWKCKFKPAMQGDIPVACWVQYAVRFSGGADSDFQPSSQSPKLSGDQDSSLPGPEEFVEVDSMPVMVYEEAPIYPRDAKAANHTGTVWIKALVDQKGAVRAVRVHQSTGHESLDNAAIAAAWKNRFTPATKNGEPVAVWITYRIDFKLSEH